MVVGGLLLSLEAALTSFGVAEGIHCSDRDDHRGRPYGSTRWRV